MMELILPGMAIFTLVYLLLTVIECLIGFHRIKNLSEQDSLPASQLPSVSIIFSALNEETTLEKALLSMLELDYPYLEIIAINDRSTDATPVILEKMQRQHANLHVFHIHQLPDGWLGKNHALQFASQQAKGDWLLFTDADVLMKKPTILKSVSYALENNLDHLTIFDTHRRKQFQLKILLLGSYIGYILATKPWRIRYTWSKKYLGHGAFNLVKKSSYLQCGAHHAIAMECLDDMKLGHLIKSHGFKEDGWKWKEILLNVSGMVHLVKWLKGCKKTVLLISIFNYLLLYGIVFLQFYFLSGL